MLENIKLLLGLDGTELDERIKLLITMATMRLQILLGGIEPPETLDYIITEVVVSRFNRIGSEGLKTHTVEGESQSFTDSDFDNFKDDIQAYLNSQTTSTRGKVRFI